MTKQELAINAFKNQLGLILDCYCGIRKLMYENSELIMFYKDINGSLTLKFLPSGQNKIECLVQTSSSFEIFDVDMDFNVCDEKYKPYEINAKCLIVNAMLEWQEAKCRITKALDDYRTLKFLSEEK